MLQNLGSMEGGHGNAAIGLRRGGREGGREGGRKEGREEGEKDDVEYGFLNERDTERGR
jgi:hypothetical protein